MKLRVIVLMFVLISTTFTLFGQISHGGYPIDVQPLKSINIQNDEIVMPPMPLNTNDLARDKYDLHTKSIVFAFPFQVNISPDKDGHWTKVGNINIWNVDIISEGAYSLNLIFSKFKLPEGARLFLFNEDKTEVLGAFTSENNNVNDLLAVYPVEGEKLTVQYEESEDVDFKGILEIGQVAHDFLGVFSNPSKRRPLGLSESCNINANCDEFSGLENEKRSVCRVIAAGIELCTGTLVNNTSNDGKPYILTAYHAFRDTIRPLTTIFDFNYESPACANIDGDDIQTLSGSVARALFDSADFILLEMNSIPPASYRTYYSGWDCTSTIPGKTYTIHHPIGDTKKISYDAEKKNIATYGESYLSEGDWHIAEWDYGTTEGGSSGAALFDASKHIVGTLTGGLASCSSNKDDYFARFDKMWDYSTDPKLQLKCWLDPQNTGAKVLNGMNFYKATHDNCSAFCNVQLSDYDTVYPIINGNNQSVKGYYTGTNAKGITEVAEKFTGIKSCVLSGISVGIGHVKTVQTNGVVKISVYQGALNSDSIITQFLWPIKSFHAEAMNYIALPNSVNVKGDFFVSFEVPLKDTLSIYQTKLRSNATGNSFYAKQNGEWIQPSELYQLNDKGAALLLQINACSIDYVDTLVIPATLNGDLLFGPNPVSNKRFTLNLKGFDLPAEVTIVDILGKVQFTTSFDFSRIGVIELPTIKPGVYIMKVKSTTASISKTVRLLVN